MLVDSVYAKWVDARAARHDSVARRPAEALRGFMFDVGMSDQLVSPASQMAMDSAFTRAGVRHTFETYDGDHTNRVAVRVGDARAAFLFADVRLRRRPQPLSGARDAPQPSTDRPYAT